MDKDNLATDHLQPKAHDQLHCVL